MKSKAPIIFIVKLRSRINLMRKLYKEMWIVGGGGGGGGSWHGRVGEDDRNLGTEKERR